MATPDMDVIKDIPGYKVILKAVLKAQIQQLVEQLAEYTEEDSIILTASVHDGTLSHLGSDSGKSFLDDHEDVKSQFLGFCLKYHHKKKQEKEQREREEREEAMRKAAAAAANTAAYSPRHAFMPTRSPRHPSPRFMGSRHPLRSATPRHQPYPVTRPIRVPAMPVSSPLKSPNKIDGQVIKIEPDEDNDDTSNQDAGDSNVCDSDSNVQSSSQSPSHSNPPSTPSKVKSESGDKDDDTKSESSSSTIPNEPPSEALGLDSDLSNLISGTNQPQTSETSEIDPTISVKLEALTENEMELEITGVEPGRPPMPQDNWDPNVSMGMNFDPTGATGSQVDMAAQGYNLNFKMAKRFTTFTSEEITKKHNVAVPVNTTKNNKAAAEALRQYLNEQQEDTNFEDFSEDELAEVLGNFYINARTNKGEQYKKKGFECLRYSINRYLKGQPHCKKFDIITSDKFKDANKLYKAALEEIKSSGKGDVVHYKRISDDDLLKLYCSVHLAPDTPSGLMNRVQMNVRLYFCRKANDNMASMTKTTFNVGTYPCGKRFLKKTLDESTEYYRDDGNIVSRHIPEDPDNQIFCPVETYLKYVSKLNPNCDRLWQYPKNEYRGDDDVWYQNKPLGRDALSKFMSRLSQQVPLSSYYTNHCINVTGTTVLSSGNFSMAQISPVSGHKIVSPMVDYQIEIKQENP